MALFGSELRTDILIAIGRLGNTYISELARLLDRTPTEITRAVSSLESAGIVASRRMGQTRVISLEPRYLASDELYALLLRLSELPKYKGLWSQLRRRPRAIGKPL